jgi:hypothetical protein
MTGSNEEMPALWLHSRADDRMFATRRKTTLFCPRRFGITAGTLATLQFIEVAVDPDQEDVQVRQQLGQLFARAATFGAGRPRAVSSPVGRGSHWGLTKVVRTRRPSVPMTASSHTTARADGSVPSSNVPRVTTSRMRAVGSSSTDCAQPALDLLATGGVAQIEGGPVDHHRDAVDVSRADQ